MKFLLIEYEPRYLEQIRQFLAAQSQAIELVVARDGEEGLELYRKSRPDLVLISSVLPKLRTPEVIKAMQDMGPTPPVLLMMSGYKGRNRRTDAQRVGATSILEKPFSEDVFQAEVAMALGLRPAIAMPPPRPKSDPNMPLLSADDIFSDVLTGLDEEDAQPAKPVSREATAPGPSVEKLLRDTLSGLGPPKKSMGGPSAPFPAAEPPRERPLERTARVNVAEAMANLSARSASGPRSPEPAARAAPSSVDKLLKDTLSGIMPLPKAAVPSPASPGRPKEISRGVSDETVRLSAAAPPPSVPARAAPDPPAALPLPELTRPVPTVRPASSPGRFGRYQLLEKIGAGGMAEVFKARMSGERGFEKIVAIKRIVPHMATNTDFVTMFVEEAKLAAQLNHNNITHIYDLGKVDAWHYIAMEYVAGKDLRTLLKMAKEKDVPLPAELALFIAAKIANALDYAHRRLAPDGSELHLVHRDVSPQNILISDEGDIKLCDFGIAKAASKVSTTMSGALKGKLQYMSPEQAWGKRLDRRSDIFSLGSVLFEMLTGAPLFEGDTDMSILESVRLGEVAPPTSRGVEVPKRVDEIVLKALAKNPQDRYQNASELEKDLHAVLYTFQPSPGPADLAIYMNRLLEAPQPSEAESDAEIDAAFAAARDTAPTSAPEVPPKKGKGLVIVKAPSGELLRQPVPAPELRPEPVPRRAVGESTGAPVLFAAGESKKSRMGLVAGIGLAAAVLVGGALFFTKDRWSGPKPAAGESTPKSEAQAASSLSPASAPPQVAPPVAEAPKIIDPKAVEAEARRLAAEREKAQRDAAKSGAAAKSAAGSAPPAAVGLAPAKPAEPPNASEAAPSPAAKAVEPAPVPTAIARATEPPPAEPVVEAANAAPPVQAAVPDKPPAIPAPSSAPVKEGDLVGPGEGVVEPRLVRLGAMPALPGQARQVKRGGDGSIGTPFLMALVDERGAVLEVRVIRPSNYKFVDEAAMRALKGATIQPATKDGVKVKMWKTFPISVKP